MSRNIKRFLKNKSNDYSDIEDKFYKITGKSLMVDSCFLNEVQKDNSKLLSASVVIPAWNVEKTIIPCLTAIEQSSFNQKYSEKLQVIVTNDGSSDNTLKLLKKSNFKLNLTIVDQHHNWQGQAMNAGIGVAEGDIIIEVDADTILNYFAIENLMSRHQFYRNALYTGFRSDIDKNDVRANLENIKTYGPDHTFYFTKDERIKFWDAGWPNNMCLASNHYKRLGNSKGLWMPKDKTNKPSWILPDMVFGMLFSLPRTFFRKIGGFDDRFRGWGCDDGYVGAKALSEGVFIIPVYTATGLHITHLPRTVNKQTEWIYNRKFFTDFINSTDYEKHPDGIMKAKERIKNIFLKETTSVSKNNSDKKIKPVLLLNTEQLLAIGRYKEAYKQLLKKQEKDEQYFLNLSKALRGLKRHRGCIKVLTKFISGNKKKSEDVLFQLVLSLASDGKFVKALAVLKQIAKINSQYPELSYWLYRDSKLAFKQGVNYFKQGFYDVAQKCFEASLISNPTNRKAISYRNKCRKEVS